MIKSYKDRIAHIGETVDVYRNLNKDTLSIRSDGKVKGHAQVVWLSNVEFKVGERARSRVLELGVRSVHAFVQGELEGGVALSSPEWVDRIYQMMGSTDYHRVYYNPFKVDAFVKWKSKEPVHRCKKALVVLDRIYVLQ